MTISKSKYLKYFQCPKILWLEKYKKELTKSIQEQLQENNKTQKIELPYNPIKMIDNFSIKLYNSKSTCENDDFTCMYEKTLKFLKDKKIKSIHKATLKYDNTYFVVDILKKVKKGYIVYLVKPSKNLRQTYLIEMSYLKYILEDKLNMPIYRYCVVTINPNFVKNGDIDPKKYFKVNYVGSKIKDYYKYIPANLENCNDIMSSCVEPEIEFSTKCCGSHECQYLNYCRKPLPNLSIFDLHACTNKIELYNRNIISFQDVLDNNIPLDAIQKRQIDYALNDLPIYVDIEKLKIFLSKLKFPLYFLDFESTQEELPIHDGIKPFEQVPFQYSLHYILEEGGELNHKEFLANENQDPRIELVKHLVEDIPQNSCIVAYNDSFERGVITRLAKNFPEYSEHLLKLSKNFIDLSEPFQNGYIYNREMKGSFSLKSVLPALYPNCPELNYSNLEDIHNGVDARIIFPNLAYMKEEDRLKERQNLLKYCFLDTYAMVKIWQKLIDLCNGKL